MKRHFNHAVTSRDASSARRSQDEEISPSFSHTSCCFWRCTDNFASPFFCFFSRSTAETFSPDDEANTASAPSATTGTYFRRFKSARIVRCTSRSG